VQAAEDQLESVDCGSDVLVKAVEQGDAEVQASDGLWSSLTKCLSIFNTDLFVLATLLPSSS
jgi:hypothetical protein